MVGILMGMEVPMKRLATGTGLVVAFFFSHACAGKATMSGAESQPMDGAKTGYGEEPTERVAGASTSLESEEESGGSFATMVDMLRGRVPGLQISESPNGEISARIRGDQSLYFNAEPLLVVDGVSVPPYAFSSTLRAMDPRDVRNIQVLKDAGSTSSYGIRGAHGVILISLKRR